jgi:hypothetical protein
MEKLNSTSVTSGGVKNVISKNYKELGKLNDNIKRKYLKQSYKLIKMNFAVNIVTCRPIAK